ncbi:MAG TPA: DUF1592 domain-containing protein [Bryobacteraceae bacterium]|nr:DUF1592 domain-containing protein [Bryobacteraceae bacterium]
MRIFGLFVVLSAAGQTPDFATQLYPVLEKAQCRACHAENGVASASRLQFPDGQASAAEIRAFGLSLQRLVDRARPEQSLLVTKPTNRVNHPGGERLKQGSPDESALLAWTSYLASRPAESSAAAVAGKALPTVLRRLTHSQYNNTVAELLGDRTRPANRFPPEDVVNGFTNQAEGQNISPLMAEDYARAAAKLARDAARSGAIARLIPCDKRAPGCGLQFVRAFGQRAFRRPLSDAEAATFAKLLGPDFDAQTVVEAMLQSPGFLFHTGTGQYGVAARLSYLLWDTPPDEILQQAAASGRLLTDAQIEAQARRLMRDRRAQLAMNQFLSEWLRFDRVKGALRERKLFPEFGTELIQSMLEETTRLFSYLVWEDKSFLEFFTADYSFLNLSLSQLYGVPAPASEFALTRFPAGGKRAGVLGQAAFLTLTSKPAETAPTERGLFIREHFLCQIVPPPPPGVSTTLPVIEADKPMTNRERLAIHLSSPSCAACHRLVDPIGFGFEQFDAIGRYREKQVALAFPAVDSSKKNVRREGVKMELAVDTQATILGIPGSDFNNPAEAGRILSQTPACHRCIVKQFFRYALGRSETTADRPYLEGAYQQFANSGFRFRELVLAIVKSRPFLEESSHAR